MALSYYHPFSGLVIHKTEEKNYFFPKRNADLRMIQRNANN